MSTSSEPRILRGMGMGTRGRFASLQPDEFESRILHQMMTPLRAKAQGGGDKNRRGLGTI